MIPNLTPYFERLVALDTDFQLSRVMESRREWSFNVRDSFTPPRFEPVNVICDLEDLEWSVKFCVNTVISETGVDMPLFKMT